MSRVTEIVNTVIEADLPPGWALRTIEDLIGPNGVFIDGDWVESKDQDSNGGIRLIQLADIGDGEYRNKSERFLTYEKAIELGCTFLEKGDVLIARMPDPLGRACVFPGDRKKSITVVDVAIVRSGNSEFNHRWLMYFINAPAFRSSVASLQSGSTRKRISRGNLARIALPVPPREQQNRIVTEIEKQFSRLDEAVALLKRAKTNLKRYKAAVLKAAVEGKLTEEWRKQHLKVEPASRLLERILAERRAKCNGGRKYTEPTQPDRTGLPALPSGWIWARLDTIAALKGGITVDKNRKSSGARAVPYLRVANVQRGHLDLSEIREIEAPEPDIRDLQLVHGDVLFTEGGDRDKLGRGWIWEGQIPECIHQNHVFRARMYSSKVFAKLVSWWGNSFGQRYFLREGKQTTNLASINITKLSAFPIPLPPSAEQEHMVAEVERRLSVIDELEATVGFNLTRADRLRQSILSMAFSGRLTVGEPENLRKPNSVIAS